MSIGCYFRAAAFALPVGLGAVACTDSQGRVDPVRTGALVIGTGVAASVLANNNDARDRNRNRDRDRYSWRNDQGERHSCGDGHRHEKRCGFGW